MSTDLVAEYTIPPATDRQGGRDADGFKHIGSKGRLSIQYPSCLPEPNEQETICIQVRIADGTPAEPDPEGLSLHLRLNAHLLDMDQDASILHLSASGFLSYFHVSGDASLRALQHQNDVFSISVYRVA